MSAPDDSTSAGQTPRVPESSVTALDRLGLSRAAQERVLQAFKAAMEEELRQLPEAEVEAYAAGFEGATVTFTVKPRPEDGWGAKVADATSTEGEVTGYMYGFVGAWPKKLEYGWGTETGVDDTLTGV